MQSQAPKSDVLDAKTRAALAALDATLIAALERSDIKLIRTEGLLKLNKLTYRQALEDHDISIFMPPAEAAALLRAGTREVGTLTYGWCSGPDPDPECEYLRAVQAALRDPLCSHIKALFWGARRRSNTRDMLRLSLLTSRVWPYIRRLRIALPAPAGRTAHV